VSVNFAPVGLGSVLALVVLVLVVLLLVLGRMSAMEAGLLAALAVSRLT
jgi:hypothetical protein